MTRCQEWFAWLDIMPGHQPMLHVTGRCSFPTPGNVAELRPRESLGVGSGGITIRGPELLDRNSPPPTFTIDPGPNQFVAVEVATEARLLDRAAHEAERTPANFFATWQDGPLLPQRAYTLPSPVWDRLKAAELLYVRAWSSAADTSWVAPLSTTPDTEYYLAPFIELVDVPPPPLPPDARRRDLVEIVRPPPAPVEAVPTTVEIHYREQPAVKYTVVVISPGHIVLPIEEAF